MSDEMQQRVSLITLGCRDIDAATAFSSRWAGPGSMRRRGLSCLT